MKWSAQQDNALVKVNAWHATRESPYFTLFGYAGTGKTTLAKHLAENVLGNVFFAAYTGKAAHVLMKTGIPASTIHKLIYLPRDKCGAKLADLKARREKLLGKKPVPADKLAKVEKEILVEQENLRRPDFTLNTDSPLWNASLCVVDECSMIDKQMGKDLLSFGCPILAMGDPGQLPPIEGKAFFKGKPDVMLDEILRQSEDNPIIRMSRDVREGKYLRPGNYGSSRVIRNADVPDATLASMVAHTDQLLLGMNKTRNQFNRYARGLQGRSDPLPVAGDKVVCLRNNPDQGFLNGQIWTVTKLLPNNSTKYLRLELVDEDGNENTGYAHPEPFLGKRESIDIYRLRSANEFDYGYALTVHKAQGSQWDNVLLLDEWHGTNRKEWLYTGITRAAESVTIIQ